MKAIIHERYGADALELRDVDTPVIEDHQVLVRVHASSVNPVEWYRVHGPFFVRVSSGLRRPKSPAIGADLAGRIEAVGSDIEEFRPGDEVFGTDRVCDYTQEDFTRSGERYDVILDVAGSRSFLRFRRVLKPEATVVAVGAPMSAKGLGPLKHVIGTRLVSIGRSQTVTNFVAKIEQADLAFMSELLESGKVKPVIDRRYPLSEAPEALRYLGEGHARGKIVLSV